MEICGTQNNSPIHIDLGRVNVANLLGDADDDGERLVQLELSDVVNSEVGLLKSKGHSLSGSLREVNGVDTGISPSCKSNE